MAGDISECTELPLAFGKWMSSCRDGMMASHNISVSFSKGLTNASQNSMTSKNPVSKGKLYGHKKWKSSPNSYELDLKKEWRLRGTSVSFDH